MYDCANIEMRELLPERLHDTLDALTRARVDAHLAECEECSAEYALLRSAHEVMRGAHVPRVNTSAIVAALPRPSRMVNRASTRRGNSMVWRAAAALTVVSLGGISFAALRDSAVSGIESPRLLADTSSPNIAGAAASAVTPQPGESAASVASGEALVAGRGRGLSAGGALADLGDAQLEALLGDLDHIEAAPVAEPEAMSGSRLVSGSSTGSEE
ncbi:MAG: zf-HC2 domain-containing protein [Gemmatimonadaceae bacterium]